MERIEINKISIELYQDGNTCGTTEETEELEVSFEYQAGIKEGSFMVIKTNTGWSVNDTNELKGILNIIEKGMQEVEKDLVTYNRIYQDKYYGEK